MDLCVWGGCCFLYQMFLLEVELSSCGWKTDSRIIRRFRWRLLYTFFPKWADIRMVQITETSSKPHKALTCTLSHMHAAGVATLDPHPAWTKRRKCGSVLQGAMLSHKALPIYGFRWELSGKNLTFYCLCLMSIFSLPLPYILKIFFWWCITPTSTGGNFHVPGPLFKEFPTCTRHHLDRLPSYPLTARTNLEVEKLQKNSCKKNPTISIQRN